MNDLRTFVAVDVSAAMRQQVRQLIERLAASGADVKWVAPENLHLTVYFLGGVPPSLIRQVCAVVEQVAERAEPFDLKCVGAGAFPDVRRPRTLWVALERGVDELTRLHEQLGERLGELGFPPENRRYHPHLTFGRVRRGGRQLERLAELLDEHAELDIGSTRITELIVYSSALGRGGPKYDPLSRCPLGG